MIIVDHTGGTVAVNFSHFRAKSSQNSQLNRAMLLPPTRSNPGVVRKGGRGDLMFRV